MQHAVAVLFDPEKAYESTWKFGIMRDLHNAGLCDLFKYNLVLAFQISSIRKWVYHKAVYYQYQ